MRVVALVSGGKDSCFNMLQCVAAGHEIVALANLRPAEVDELDSYMYQTVGHDAVDLYSEAMGLPLYREYIRGQSIQQSFDYEPNNEEDEVEDLYRLLSSVKQNESIEGVAVGAILSNYQRIRVENVCSRLELTALCYLWQRDQEELLGEMIAADVKAVIIKVAALGLTPEKHLGKTIRECQPEFSILKHKFGLNVCGEGGEYETLTLDCPLFKQEIEIVESKVVYHSKDPFAPVAYLIFPKLRLVPKEDGNQANLIETIKKPECFCNEELDVDVSVLNISELSSKGSSSAIFENSSSKTVCNRTETGTVFLTGIIATSENDFECLMSNLQDTLKTNGSSARNVVNTTIYTRDMSEYSRLNNIYAKYFGLNPPVRACIQVPTLSFAQLEVVAIDNERLKQTLHVQSISHWAPANIGPYSQCVQIEDIFIVSGQIGLIPGSMLLPKPSSFHSECRLALRHTSRVLTAMSPELNLDNSIQAVCYVTSGAHIELARAIWKERTGTLDCCLAIVVTSGLPKNALVEWQVIAHKETGEAQNFDITSTNKRIGAIHVNKHGNASVATGYLDELPEETSEWNNFYSLISRTVGPVCLLRIYYRASLGIERFEESRSSAPQSITFSFVPVCDLESERAATICGLSF